MAKRFFLVAAGILKRQWSRSRRMEVGVLRQAIGSITILQVGGELFGGDLAQELRRAIKDEAALGNTRLVLDMSGCSYVNSWGLAEIIGGRPMLPV
jgi:anti-anti-sigma regulatory factor